MMRIGGYISDGEAGGTVSARLFASPAAAVGHRCRWAWWPLLLAMAVLTGCGIERQPPLGKAWQGRRGANCLQVAAAPLNSQAAAESLARLREVGADTVAFIPFLYQETAASLEVSRSDAVTDEELLAAIDAAHRLGFAVVVKPQVLVGNGWAGTIDPGDEEGWRQWFAAYSQALLHYARLAEQQGAEWLVIGTEINRAAEQPQWAQLIAEIRGCYRGRLTYAAHNIEGVHGFAYWHLLDCVGVSYYPSLGGSAALPDLRRAVEGAVDRLAALSREMDRPLWLLEFGIPSAQGAHREPWRWRQLDEAGDGVDVGLQARVIDLWLENIAQPWLYGALIWCWYSNPRAGGDADPHHTVQNKPAEALLRLHWQR